MALAGQPPLSNPKSRLSLQTAQARLLPVSQFSLPPTQHLKDVCRWFLSVALSKGSPWLCFFFFRDPSKWHKTGFTPLRYCQFESFPDSVFWGWRDGSTIQITCSSRGLSPSTLMVACSCLRL